MWKVPKYMYAIVIIPFLVVGIGMVFYALMSSPQNLNEMGLPENQELMIFGILFIIFPFISALGVNMFYNRINVRESNLIKHGLRGEAEIVSREQTGMYMNELPQIKFYLNIKSPNGDIFQIEHKDYVNMLDLSVITVGAKIPVYIDPNNQQNILLIYEPVKAKM